MEAEQTELVTRVAELLVGQRVVVRLVASVEEVAMARARTAVVSPSAAARVVADELAGQPVAVALGGMAAVSVAPLEMVTSAERLEAAAEVVAWREAEARSHRPVLEAVAAAAMTVAVSKAEA